MMNTIEKLKVVILHMDRDWNHWNMFYTHWQKSGKWYHSWRMKQFSQYLAVQNTMHTVAFHWKKSGAVFQNSSRVEPFWKTVPPWRVEPFFPLIIMFRKKKRPFFRQEQLHLWRWHQNSARGGAELRTMKPLQGWSRFGSTFFCVM